MRYLSIPGVMSLFAVLLAVLTVTPATASIAMAGTQQYTATASFDDFQVTRV